MKTRCLFVFGLAVGIVAQVTQAATSRPVPVSPGNASGLSRIAERCPTFSWGSAAGAKFYELVVYRVPDEKAASSSEAVKVLQVKLPGSASSWTPPLAQCLGRGKSYAWSVRAVGRKATRDWSELALFQIASGPSADEFQEALAVVQRYLTIHGEAAAFEGGRSGVGEALEPSAASQDKERISTPQGTAGPSFSVDAAGNVQGTSFTGDGSGLTNVTAADLVCAGCVAESELAFDPATQGELDGHKTSRDHDSSYVAKAGDTMTGALTIQQFLNGQHLLATIDNTGPFSAAGLRLKTPAAGNDWTVAAQETGAGVARGFEIQHPTIVSPFAISASTGNVGVGTVSASERLEVAGNAKATQFIGNGSLLTGVAPASGSPNYVAKAGDTMTGSLNLPGDGLVVGTNQLVTSGGNVGIATASPSHPLHLSKFLNGAHLVAMVENTGPFSAAALRLKTPAAGNEWSWAAQETGAGAARGLEVQNPSFATPPLAIAASTGFVGIGVLSPADKLQVAGDIRVGTGTTGCVKDADGTVIAGTCSSDVRLKKNITPLPRILERITRLTPVSFNWRSEEFPELALGEETQLGLIAQEVERILPELVSLGDDGLKRIHYSDLPILLLQAVKEQRQQNEKLRRRVSELSMRLSAMER